MTAPPPLDPATHRRAGIEANNTTWDLLGADSRSPTDDADMLARAYASAYHWARAEGRTPENDARAAWLVSRVHAVLGHGELALGAAQRCVEAVAGAGLGDFDLAYAHEATARALACLGRVDEARVELDAACAVPVADDEDRAIVEGDIATGPWFGLDE